MWCSIERGIQTPPEEELLAAKEEPHEVLEQPLVKEQIMEISTQEEPSREGRKRTREDDILLQDARENVGAPTNLFRKRRSPKRDTSYMALMNKIVKIEPSSFKEAVEKHVWVDAMVEEYETILKNNVWEVVSRLTDKSLVGLRWLGGQVGA